MNITHLKITRKDYIKILNKRGIIVPSNITTPKLLRKVKSLRKKGLRYIANIRCIPKSDHMSTDDIIKAIYTHIHRKKQDEINEILTRSNLTRFVPRQNISRSEVDEILRLHMSLNDLKGIAKLCDIMNYDNLSKADLIYTILRSEKNFHENNYLNYIRNNANDEIKRKIIIIRIQLAGLDNIITKQYRESIKKYLHTVENMVNVTDTDKDKINNRLLKIIFDLNERNKSRHIDYDDQNYYGIKDIEHLYINPDDYYKTILAKQSFDNNCRFYICRGDKNKELSLKQYINKVIPYLGDLINKKKDNNQKLQLESA